MVIAIMAMTIFAAALFAQASEIKYGMYSTLELHEESGDLVGIEVYITPKKNSGCWVVYMESEGDVEEPVVVPAKITNNTITFDVRRRGNKEKSTFTGTFNADGYLMGKFADGSKAPDGKDFIKLRRGNGYWQK